MIDTPHVTRTESRLAAVIHFTIPRAEIRDVMGPGIQELMKVVADQGIVPAGPIFSHHFRMDPETFDFELGLPVNEPIRESGRVRPGELPARVVARTIYRGPYEGLGGAWGEFNEWVSANGHTPAPELWESYAKGPETGSEPERWETELTRPLVGKG